MTLPSRASANATPAAPRLTEHRRRRECLGGAGGGLAPERLDHACERGLDRDRPRRRALRLLRRVCERVELARERVERRIALLRILGEGAAQDRLERRPAREAVSPERERREIDDVPCQLLARETQARVHPAREQQIEQRGKRVLLRGAGQLRRAASEHGAGGLGRAQGVEARAEQGSRRGVRVGCREREVDQTDGTIDVNEHVARVDLAVENAALM